MLRAQQPLHRRNRDPVRFLIGLEELDNVLRRCNQWCGQRFHARPWRCQSIAGADPRRPRSDVASAWVDANSQKADYWRLMAGAEADREAAARAEAETVEVLRETEARECGAGRSSSRDCRKALRRLVVDADTGWLSSNVKVDKEGRRILSDACLR